MNGSRIVVLLIMSISRVAFAYPNLQRFAIRSARRSPLVHDPAFHLRYLASAKKESSKTWGLKSTETSTLLEQAQVKTAVVVKNETALEEVASINATNTTGNWSRSFWKPLRRAAGAVASTSGFISSATTSFVVDRAQYRRIKPSVDAFTKFLNTSGIDLELSSSLNYHLPRNIVVLSRIQRILNTQNDRRELARSTKQVNLPSNEEAKRYMRYATAAYGSNMIAAAEMDAKGKFDTRWSPVTKTRISEHIDVPEDDIVLMDVDYGNDINHLRHYVAVDHTNKKVVLAIRGTFTLSEIVVDVAAFSRKYDSPERFAH